MFLYGDMNGYVYCVRCSSLWALCYLARYTVEPLLINSLNAMGTFMCPYKIEKNMYFILTPNIKANINSH